MSNICCFTGHRDLRGADVSSLYTKLYATVRQLINEGYTDFRAGGAIGFDTIAAACVLEMKQEFPNIKLHLILPCENQDRYFSKFEKRAYKYILQHADSVEFVRKKYFNGVMAMRNRALVSGSDICVAFLKNLRGGTFQTVNMARKANIKVINIAK